ncbi:helix-turn-helix domain-containing protein [Evansella halocellulosilytica]|uniref:helix-turn-helix domain-containing protein n=1 Tax=Evansella halocellulosilytica TaxID=2011013 RepID=UPI000BB7E37C|nr:helix-turn-helix domain-containing protein [Evansella halocellulosilytica]
MKSESIAYYEEYRHHESFTDVAEMNEAVRAHIDQHREQLNKTAVAVLNLLSRYSCVVKGVSWMKRATIAAQLDVSDKTVSRALKRLEDCGIIKRVPTVRKRGGRGYDLVIIRRAAQDSPVGLSSRSSCESPCGSSANKGAVQEETNSINKNTYVGEAPALNELDASYTPSNVPAAFTKAARPFFRANEIFALWQRVKTAYNRCELGASLPQLVDRVVSVLKTSIFAAKRGMIRKTFRGYFYASVERTFDDVYIAETAELLRAI